MKCNCQDWTENIEKVNAPLLLASARSGGTIQYDGKRFAFCPWCSMPLADDETPRPQPDPRVEKALCDYDDGKALDSLTPSAAEKQLLPRREDAKIDADGHCTVCGCEIREYHGGTDEEALDNHVCPAGFRTVASRHSGQAVDADATRRATIEAREAIKKLIVASSKGLVTLHPLPSDNEIDSEISVAIEKGSRIRVKKALDDGLRLSQSQRDDQRQAVDRQGEWTARTLNDSLDQIWCGDTYLGCCERSEASKLIISHNAAIERDETEAWQRNGANAVSGLERELHAERQRAEQAEQLYDAAENERQIVKSQLLSALAAIDQAETLCIRDRPFDAIEVFKSVDLSLLHKHDAELTEKVRKPLVDALERMFQVHNAMKGND